MIAARKVLLLGSLYFAQGLPFGFYSQALPVLLTQRGMPLPQITLTWLLAIPWALKMLWAPWVDRCYSRKIGKRRSWILPLQAVTVVALLVLAVFPPTGMLLPLFVSIFIVNFLNATQDIAIDALAFDVLHEQERGFGNGLQVGAYRLGMIVGGGVLLMLFQQLGWHGAFVVMALLSLLATLPTYFHREAQDPSHATQNDANGATKPATRPSFYAFFHRKGMKQWLLLLILYKGGEAFATGVLRPLLAQRYSLDELGFMLGTVGFVAGLLGAVLGGSLTSKLGARRTLIMFSTIQALTVATFVLFTLPQLSKTQASLLIALEHFSSGMATAALFTAMMHMCSAAHAATDYATQACTVVIATGIFAALSGTSAHAFGFRMHFLAATGFAAAAALFAPVLVGDNLSHHTQETSR